MASKTLRQVKAALRKHVDGFVHALPQSEVETQSAQITRHVLDSPAFKQARSVGLYASFPDHEASTVDLARQVLQHGKHLYMPYITRSSPESSDPGAALPEGSRYEMSMLQVNKDHYEEMKPNQWGIPMPQHPKQLKDALNPQPGPEDGLDLMFLPATAYDKYFNRLGRGKGFYDRYIEKLEVWAEQTGRPKPFLVGMILNEQYLEEEHIPLAQHDKGVQACVIANGWKGPSQRQ